MSRAGWIALALVAGAGLPLQAGINAALRKGIGSPLWASAISFGVGTLVLLTLAAATRATVPSPAALGSLPAYAWVGGVIGAFYVTATIVLAPRLGAAAFTALVVGGQMALALALDQLGALGFPQQSLSAGRLLGAGLLVAGVALIQRF